jgi:ATP-dependent DNA helicase RecG
MTDNYQYEYMLQQRFNGYGFDHQTATDATMDDIDAEDVYRFVELANSVRSMNENIFLAAEQMLEKLDLIKEGSITRACLLLFGKNPHKFFSVVLNL